MLATHAFAVLFKACKWAFSIRLVCVVWMRSSNLTNKPLVGLSMNATINWLCSLRSKNCTMGASFNRTPAGSDVAFPQQAMFGTMCGLSFLRAKGWACLAPFNSTPAAKDIAFPWHAMFGTMHTLQTKTCPNVFPFHRFGQKISRHPNFSRDVFVSPSVIT